MGAVRATCQHCHADLHLDGDAVTVALHHVGTEHVGNTYTFTCPVCVEVNVRPCEPRTASLLANVGARMTILTPAAIDRPALPPWGYDEIDRLAHHLAHATPDDIIGGQP